MKEVKSRLEEKIALILMKAGVSGPEIDDCMNWAFGKGAWYVPPFPDWIKRWNKLHGRIFEVKRRDSFVEFMYCVGFFYLKDKHDRAMKIRQN